MKRLIYRTKRFIYSLKVRWKIRKTPKAMRGLAFCWEMARYNMAQTLKGIQPMKSTNIDRVKSTNIDRAGEMFGLKRRKRETNEEFRERIMEALGDRREKEQ